MALLSALGGAVLAHILAPENFGRLADLVVPVYTILAIAILVSFSKNVESRSEKKEQNYVLKKSGAEEALTWKQKFIGNWEKTERPGFKEVTSAVEFFVVVLMLISVCHIHGPKLFYRWDCRR